LIFKKERTHISRNIIKEKQKNNIKSGKTLTQKMVQGGAYLSSLRVIRKILSLIRLVIIGRILAPSDFGLMGIALLAMSAIETFSKTGYREALIQKKEEINDYLNVAWTVLIVRGFTIFILIVSLASYISSFFNTPEVKPLIQVLGFVFFLRAFHNIGVVFFHKELDFRKVFIYRFLGVSANFIVAVSTALILRSVWALVLGLLAENVTSLIVSYFIHPYKPRLSKDFKKAQELFGFGKWIFGSSILIFIGEHVDDIFVGRLVSATALGFYQMAYRICNMLETEITKVISGVAFPAYAKIQTQKQRLQNAYFRIMRLTMAITVPLAVGMVFLAPEFTMIFLGEKWMSIVVLMQLLAIAGLIKSILSTGNPLFTGSGYPNYQFYMQLVRSLTIIIFIYPLIVHMGILGAAWGVILSMLSMLSIWYFLSKKTTKASWQLYIEAFWPPMFCSAFMAGALYLFKMSWEPMRQSLSAAIFTFLMVVITSIGIYLAAMIFLHKYYPKYDILNEIQLFYKTLMKRRGD